MSNPSGKDYSEGFSSSSEASPMVEEVPQHQQQPPTSTTTSTTKENTSSFLESISKPLTESSLEAIANAIHRGGRRLRNGGGGGSSGGAANRSSNNNPTSKSNNSAPARLAGEAELEMLMNVAEYEIHQDPYRGIMSQRQSLETQTSITTPWNACEWGTLPPEPLQDPAADLLDPQIVVRHVGNCACPSMKEWTRTLLVDRAKKANTTNNSNNKKRKRKAKTNDGGNDQDNNESSSSQSSSSSPQQRQLFTVGVRPQGDQRLRGDNFVCPCDFNPLCLASLGGLVNEVIEERCRALDAALPPPPPPDPPSSKPLSKFWQKLTHKKEDGGDDDDDAEVEVLEEAPPPPKRQKEASAPTSKELIIVDVDKVESAANTRTNGGKLRDPALDDSSEDTFAFPGDNSSPSTPTKDAKRKVKQLPVTTPSLKSQAGPVAEGHPEDIFFVSTLPQEDLNCTEFSSKTNERLSQVRRSIVVDTAPIRTYIHRTLRIEPSVGENEDGLSIDKYMRILKDWHGQLQFHNPVVDRKQLSGDRISISIPPGIRNLGATCYLNTQLQCLAQNLTFLNGIFSWHMVDVNHVMNSVMEKMQFLLARMFMGGECRLTTRQFSNALGLQHHEQQDPNEFARLLFDRMEESFQQCDNDGDLSNLLNRIFHGVTTYETICMTCGKASERSEGFMDLNLPIVKPPKETSNKKKSGTIQEAFALSSAKNVDTDLQYCLNQYTCAEMLDGENQYFCDVCNAKRDAKRILKLTELPPVLNVQLSRYVYDREKGEKKKVSDKVLLPKALTVQTGGVTKKKYLLCAVMRHQGTSAYSGHYLAEAMDWLTGTWFEFNDEIVKLLPDGPSFSFDPEAVEATNGSGDTKGANTKEATATLSGSQDAYNMYYVEEGYLSTTTKKGILWRKKLAKSGPNPGEALDDVSDDRKEIFKDLGEMCLQDSRSSERLNRRKAGIRKYVLPNVQALVANKSSSVRELGAWVPTDLLRRYLECRVDPVLDSRIEELDPVFDNDAFLCEHKCLSPQTARTGKLLPIPLYNALMSLLRGERAMLRQEEVSAIELSGIEGRKITPTSNLICQVCSKTHRDQLSEKLEMLRGAKDLYDALDTKTADAAVDFEEGEEPKSDEDMYVYVVSRQSATKFRRRMTAIIKSVAKSEGGGNLDDTFNTNQTPIYEGLGAIDLSSITQHTRPENGTGKFNGIESNNDELDKHFNTNITCSHGNCNYMYNSRQVRFVSQRVWNLVKKLFPDAIEHRRKRELNNGNNAVDLSDQECYICKAEKASVETLKDAINAWAIKTREDASLKSLLDVKRTRSREQEISNFATAKDGCRLVHKSDIMTWREAVKLFSNSQKIKGDNCDEVRLFAEKLAFPSGHAVVLDFENEPVDKLLASIRSFICREHHMVVKKGILGDAASSDANELRQLADYITVVASDEYHCYISSLATLLRILRVEGKNNRSILESPIAVDAEKAFIKQVRDVTGSHHPLIRNHQSNATGECETKNTVRFTHDGSIKTFALFPGLCEHETCMKECAPLQRAQKEKDDDRIESISVDSLETKPSAAKKNSTNLGLGASDPIMVESDLEQDVDDGPFPFRVFELEAGATKEQALESLQDISAIPNDFEGSNDLRRSNRKRKAKYPSGVLLNENSVNIGLYHNFAAICLSMNEQSSIPADYSQLFLVVTPQFEKPIIDVVSPRGQESEQTLEDKIRVMRKDRPNDEHFDPTKHTLLLYQKDRSTSGDGPLEEALLQSLFRFANFGSRSESKSTASSNKPSSPKKKKSRPSERGFQGTLLQSGKPPEPAPSSNGDDDSVIQGHPESSTISDEDKQRPRPCMVVDDSSPRSSRPSSVSHNQMILSEDDDDDSQAEALLKLPPTFSNKKPSRNTKDAPFGPTTIVDTSIIDCEEADRAEMSQRVFAELEKCVAADTANPSRMWDAIHFAFNQNKELNDASAMLDVAYAKYLSGDDNGGATD